MPLEIRMLTSVSEIALGSRFFRGVWGGQEDVVPVDIALASGHVGGYFSGAFQGENLVAASYGFAGRHDGLSVLHSHVTASQVPGAGFELKKHQRSWAGDSGFDAITWTFDPLVRRNAVFNLEKLGATAVEYLVNFYGEMHDELNRGEQSDRLFAVWPTKPATSTTASNAFADGQQPSMPRLVAIRVDAYGSPQIDSAIDSLIEKRDAFCLELPADIEQLRSANPDAASKWRLAVREVLKPAFERGAIINQMTSNRAALLIEWNQEGAK